MVKLYLLKKKLMFSYDFLNLQEKNLLKILYKV